MGYIYILTIIILGIAFMLYKKTDNKLNFIKWLIIYIVSLYAYNIVIGMILGLLNITSHIWLLSIINIAISIALGFKAIKEKKFQKYFIRKQYVIGIIIVLTIFIVMLIKDLYIHKGDITHFAVDSAVHYRAAKHYSDNLKIFINVEDKTFFNFNVMQTGAYINDGIFMNVFNSITKVDHCYLYQAFETITLFVSGLAFFALFIDKVKTTRGILISLILFGLYIYGYPYNSWIYGFSYLSVGIVFSTILVPILELIYSKENINRVFIITLLGIIAFGLMFSYCLFVPPIFVAICIYVFYKDLKEQGKTYLKIFKQNTIIITGMLLIITFVGIGYLFIHTFYIDGQTNLISALKFDGAIYSGKYIDFLPYIPFVILYCIELIKKIIDKELEYFDIFALSTTIFLILAIIGHEKGFVSKYYMLKIYFLMWIIVFGITIYLLNKYINLKIAKWIIPFYIICWASFVCIWVWIKAGHILGEEEKHSLPNYVGMYYMENCEYRKLIDLTQNFSKGQIEVVRNAQEKLENMTVENTQLITNTYYQRIWLTALTEINSTQKKYEEVVQDAREHTLEEAILDTEKKYVICISDYSEPQKEFKRFKNSDKIEILFQNRRGYVVKIIR